MSTIVDLIVDSLVKKSNFTYFNGKKTDCDIIDSIKDRVQNEYTKIEKEILQKTWESGMKSDNGHFGSFEEYYNLIKD